MYEMDKTAFSVASLHDPSDERAFWHSKTPLERLEAVELMRQVIYGYRPPAPQMQRVFEVVQLKPYDRNAGVR